MAKRGRKRKQHETSDGRIIPHFYKRKDGRFGTSLDKNKTFGIDERDAIRRYLAWLSRRDLETVVIEVDSHHPDLVEPVAIHDIIDDRHFLRYDLPSDAVWQKIGELIRDNPERAALKTGIRELAYLQDLDPPPSPLPLAEVSELYEAKDFSDPNEAKRSALYWSEFCRAVHPAVAVSEVTNEQLQAYNTTVRAMRFKRGGRTKPISPKSVKNRFHKIGSILRHSWKLKPEHRTGIENLREEFNIVCKPPTGQESESEPIDTDDFHALYLASDARWRAILLCMINFAMHPRECGDLFKDDLRKGGKELSSKRTKTGERRVAMVWPETWAAIEAYQRTQLDNEAYKNSPFVFLTVFDQPYSDGGLTQYFRETLKPRSEKLSARKLHCTLDNIRDGAQNAADDGGADPIHTEFLMGHAIPKQMQAYKRRTPQKTAKSVQCIYDHYRIGELVESGEV